MDIHRPQFNGDAIREELRKQYSMYFILKLLDILCNKTIKI